MESSKRPLQSSLSGIKRKKISLASEELVSLQPLFSHGTLPLVFRPNLEDLHLVTWAKQHRAMIQEHLSQAGGILFRGFALDGTTEFEQVVAAISGEALRYTERSSPRSQVADHVYTSTDHPPDQSIFLHNEQSYNVTWPLHIYFYCDVPAQEGGATPIADCRKIFQRIPSAVQERFAALQYMYVRNFGSGPGLSWKEAFQTDDKQAVETYCHEHAIEFAWQADDRLRTRQVRPAFARHPLTKELTWFNHATFFHIATLPQALQHSLRQAFAEEELPNNTYYGDGSPIEAETMHLLQDAYEQEKLSFPWEKGDVLLLDNMLVAHGRAPFRGPRKVLVAMAEPGRHEGL